MAGPAPEGLLCHPPRSQFRRDVPPGRPFLVPPDDGRGGPAQIVMLGLVRRTAPLDQRRQLVPLPVRQDPVLGSTTHPIDMGQNSGTDRPYLWRAVDQHGVVLDILVQDRRNATAAKRFFKRLLAGLKYKPKRLVTDGLRSYGAAHRELLPEVKHRTSRYLNNRAENSHRPTRRRERQMQRFKSPEQAQRFLSAHAVIYGHFRPRRHLMTAAQYRRARAEAFRVWRQETCVQMVASARRVSCRAVKRVHQPNNLAIPIPAAPTQPHV